MWPQRDLTLAQGPPNTCCCAFVWGRKVWAWLVGATLTLGGSAVAAVGPDGPVLHFSVFMDLCLFSSDLADFAPY